MSLHLTSPKSLAAVALAAVLAACGSSGDSGSGGLPGNGTQVTKGAITKTSSGRITVNGVDLSTSGAAVTIEKSAASAGALAPGMIVTVRGTFDDRTGTADEIEFEDALTGTVDDKGTDHLVIGGREVHVDASTELAPGFDLASLDSGERVRVSGVPDDKGGLRATRIDSPSPASEDFEVKGFVSNLDAQAGTFELRLSPDATAFWNVSLAQGATLPAGIANGSFVEVRSASAVSGTDLVAASISLEDDGFDEASEIEVEGIVSSGDSSAFVVAGQAVVTNDATRWVFGVPADLLPGVKVEVEGHGFDANGALVAEKVAFRAVVRLQGPAKDVVVDGSVTSFTVMGIPVTMDAFTDDRLPGALAADMLVELRGMPGRDGASVIATRIEDTNDDRLILTGVVTAADAAAGSVQILGITGASTGGTEYHPHNSETNIGRDAFFAQVTAGQSVVKVRGADATAISGTTLTAEEMELEDHE